jgi:GH15 family glucan-1,4-alpha-glucosidase
MICHAASNGNEQDHFMALRIEDYAFIGNCVTGALVGRDGSVDWLALPRFDSPACFASLLGEPRNGRWLIAPQGPVLAVERRYRGETLILETRFRIASGSVVLTDFMPLQNGREAIRAVRLIRGEQGNVAMKLEAIFRFDYGRIVPWVQRHKRGLRAIAGPDALVLDTPLTLEGRDLTTVANFIVSEGDIVPCVLTWYPSHKGEPKAIDPLAALADSEKRWLRWSRRYSAPGEWRDATIRSLLTLKALTYAPTGGIIAALAVLWPKFKKFPANSLFIREFGPETGSLGTTSSAT